MGKKENFPKLVKIWLLLKKITKKLELIPMILKEVTTKENINLLLTYHTRRKKDMNEFSLNNSFNISYLAFLNLASNFSYLLFSYDIKILQNYFRNIFCQTIFVTYLFNCNKYIRHRKLFFTI